MLLNLRNNQNNTHIMQNEQPYTASEYQMLKLCILIVYTNIPLHITKYLYFLSSFIKQRCFANKTPITQTKHMQKESAFIPVSNASPLDLGFLVEGNCLASPMQNSQDGKKI